MQRAGIDTSSGGMKSAAGMSMFSKAKCGALHKHCLMGNCGGKRFDGHNWAAHVKYHMGTQDQW
jgi:hypothetical protein